VGGEEESGKVSNQPKEYDLKELIAEFGHLILTDENAFFPHRRMLSKAMKCYAGSVCRLLKIMAEKPENEKLEIAGKLAALIVSAAAYASIASVVYRAYAAVSGERLPEDFVYLYALSGMLWHLLAPYVLYEPFIVYARYPKGRCSPLDITKGTYVVNMAKLLIEDKEFKDKFKCVKELIERDVKTERCREILERAEQELSSIVNK